MPSLLTAIVMVMVTNLPASDGAANRVTPSLLIGPARVGCGVFPIVDAPAAAHSRGVVAKVLIVDDSAHFRAAAAELLADRGLEVFGLAADGVQATELINPASPDGALIDINLAGPDGFTIASALAAACPRVRIVMTSANVDRVSDELLRASGAAAFVPKDELASIDLAELFSPAGT
jgi:CheY-like chemotaxis protein